MKRNFYALILFLVPLVGMGQNLITLDPNQDKQDIVYHALILEDTEHAFTPEEVLNFPEERWQPVTKDNLDFTSSSYWLKFSLKNPLDTTQLWQAEIARPITNKVILYDLKGKTIQRIRKSGDDFDYDTKEIDHRKNMFAIQMRSLERHDYLLQLESDGEMLTIPIIIWKNEAFKEYDYNEQFLIGFYYGLLAFVALIYFFFFIVMRDKSFLYYVIYVIGIAGLQFALDGLAFQFLFPHSNWLANHIVLVFGAGTIIFVLLYAKYFIKTAERLPRIDKLYNGMIVLFTIALFASFLPGFIYQASYPIINIGALISIILVPTAIILATKKGHKISIFFSIAFVFWIIGAVIFILRNLSILENTLFTEHVLKIFSALEVIFLSFSMANKYREMQKEKEEAQRTTLLQMEETAKLQESINIRLEIEVKERTREIEAQKELLAEKNRDIMGSIHYARRIQQAILPSDEQVKSLLPDSFILYKPRDIVSGDFYWIDRVETAIDQNMVVFAAADCTGHGVPGAFVSIVGNNFLELSKTMENVNTPAQALNFLNYGVNGTFNEKVGEATVRDGMDIALCAIDYEKADLFFAGAKNPVLIIRKSVENPIRTPKLTEGGYDLFEIKGDKQPIGRHGKAGIKPFTDHHFKLQKGDTLYVFSDGYQDQFGGPQGRKFMTLNLKRLLIEIQEMPMEEQQIKLDETMADWMSDKHNGTAFEQIDDILIMGVRYN